MRRSRPGDEGSGAGEPRTKNRLEKETPEFSGVRLYLNSFWNFIAKQAPKHFCQGSSPRAALICFSPLSRLPAAVRGIPGQGSYRALIKLRPLKPRGFILNPRLLPALPPDPNPGYCGPPKLFGGGGGWTHKRVQH